VSSFFLARRGLVAAPLVAVVALGSACFDWTTRAFSAQDGASPSDASPPEEREGADAAAEDGESPEAGPSCPELVAAVVSALPRARRCTLGAGHCVTKVKDECDCEHFVGTADSPETLALQESVARAIAAKCRDHCGSCAFLPTQGTCLTQSGVTSCSP